MSRLHLLRDPSAPKTLCNQAARVGAVTLSTAPIAFSAGFALCGECVRNSYRIREVGAYQPWNYGNRFHARLTS